MPTAKKILKASLLSLSAFVVGALFAPQARAQDSPLPPQDVVVLIDCSDSVAPYLPAIQGIMSRFVGGSRRGDSFTCYQFASSPVLVARSRVEQTGDIARLRSQLEQLHTRGNLTNYSPALERALADIKTSYSAHPANERVLIMVTDGRRDPRDTRSETISFERLLAVYADLQAGEAYSFYCFYLGDWFEEDLQAYLLSAGAYLANWPKDVERLSSLSIADIRIVDDTSFLSELPDVPTQDSFFITFDARRPPADVAMIELDVRSDFTAKTLDRYFSVRPRRFICKEYRWDQRFDLETRGFSKGDYSGIFHFRPAQPEALLLYPRTVDFSFSVSGGLQVNIPADLDFGPTGLGGEYEETKHISISPSGTAFPGSASAVSVSADIELPDGVVLKFSRKLSGSEIIVGITTARTQPLSRATAGTYTGRIFLDPQAGWMLTDTEIPISVDVSEAGVAWGKVLLYASFVVGAIAVVIVLLFVFENARKTILDYLAKKTRPVGKLIVTHDPTRGTATNINLDRLAEGHGVKEVGVGVGPGALVELPHISMIDKLYVFSGRKVGDEVVTVVEAIKATDQVIVNEMSRTGEVQIRHLDTVKLGDFEFRYEIPRPLRQVVLYYLTGEVHQGWLLSWNIDSDGFHFLHREDARKESYVRFYELKAVAFVRDFDGELTQRLLATKMPRSGHRVRLFLADQEELTGYVINHEDPGEKFYFFPDTMGDNVMCFLIEKNTIRNMALLEEDESGARLARKMLTQVLGEMKKEVAG